MMIFNMITYLEIVGLVGILAPFATGRKSYLLAKLLQAEHASDASF
jgi:hypothetical protein